MSVEVSEPDDVIVLRIPVLWEGWECDSEAWIMERPDGSRYIKTTNHGGSVVVNREWLIKKTKEYMEATEQSLQALILLENNDNKKPSSSSGYTAHT